jgi:hypothetical protein
MAVSPWPSLAVSNSTCRKSRETEDLLGAGRKWYPAQGDRRLYPSSHDRYDLARLARMPGDPRYRYKEKAVRKYNIPLLGLVEPDVFKAHLLQYRTQACTGGVPGFIDAFFKGEPDGRSGGFAIQPEQFCGTRFDPRFGGFLISPNPSYLPGKSQSFPQAGSVLENTRRAGTGFGLVAYWVPPCTYERYETFARIFPDTDIPTAAPMWKDFSQAPESRHLRSAEQESNDAYKARTGIDFLSVPLDLRAEHIPLLQDLRDSALAHLSQVYGCDAAREKVEIYTHSPIYALDTCGVHFHIRVNEGRHPLERDIRYLSIDDAIAQLHTEGRITHLPTTRSGQVIDCVITVKANKSAANGLVATAVPNVWATPKRSS